MMHLGLSSMNTVTESPMKELLQYLNSLNVISDSIGDMVNSMLEKQLNEREDERKKRYRYIEREREKGVTDGEAKNKD